MALLTISKESALTEEGNSLLTSSVFNRVARVGCVHVHSLLLGVHVHEHILPSHS